MKHILWFRRDLRVGDSAILHYASGEVLPIFIFDKNILDKLDKDDKRVTFIYQSVLSLKQQLQDIGLDLAIFYGEPKEIFQALQMKYNFDEVLCSCDFDSYAIARDKSIESILPMRRFYDSYLIHPNDGLKSDGTPYKVFTPFYKSLYPLWSCDKIDEYSISKNVSKFQYDYSYIPTLLYLGFQKQNLAKFLKRSTDEMIKEFIPKLDNYQEARDYFFLNGTSNLAVHLRFGLISPKQVFNKIKRYKNSEFFIRELFWREFYNYILYHYPKSEFENFKVKEIVWSDDKVKFQAWCDGATGVPIIDASMRYLNSTGLMHNRLRMIVAFFLTKNLFLPWKWGEQYFAKKLLDYDASSNIGSWQWSASTGADSVPYFRVFNPYTQSAKFDKDGLFIKSVLKELRDVKPKLLHKENGVSSSLFIEYPKAIVDIKLSRSETIKKFRNL
ncbi:MAG: deoxyribodipyrimidine photo-lyase [Campylobacterota bacterium]|nr:deoxyribodipyrimidine photo-lyase [Campylobacterota bacterium]